MTEQDQILKEKVKRATWFWAAQISIAASLFILTLTPNLRISTAALIFSAVYHAVKWELHAGPPPQQSTDGPT